MDLPDHVEPGPGKVLSEVYQAPNHETKAFTGARLGDHPMLETGTSNNNMVQVDDPDASTGYRFIGDSSQTLPVRRAREGLMDANPWTYQVMAKEMIREDKVEPAASPDTPEMSDQRNYLWAEVDKDTTYAAAPPSGSWAGTALQVKLTGDDHWCASNHGRAGLVDLGATTQRGRRSSCRPGEGARTWRPSGPSRSRSACPATTGSR